MIQFLICEFYKRVTHIIPLIGKDTRLNIQLINDPRKKVEDNISNENKQNEIERNKRKC